MGWKQLFVRYGWLIEEVALNVFNTDQELLDNILFFTDSLDAVNSLYELRNNRLILKSAAPSERMWRSVVHVKHRGATGKIGLVNVRLTQLDPFIAGVVRQLNRLGFQTTRSCDGHEREYAHVMLARGEGNEGRIQAAVAEQLAPLVDKLTVDRFGNLFAEKTYRAGNGPTILLNTHLDTVFEIVHGRHIIKEGNIWTSNEGILGADDRAGVAVLLELARRLPMTNFSGKVKFIFTVEEEVGLVGASQVDEYFLWDVAAAIVVDRRGTGDIVTSCGSYLAFCQKAYGQFFEYVARKYNMDGWKCTAGGSSDTRIWASHGIESVNLSVGYQHEHTDQEYVDVAATYRIFQLLMAVFEEHWTLKKALKRMKRERGA